MQIVSNYSLEQNKIVAEGSNIFFLLRQVTHAM